MNRNQLINGNPCDFNVTPIARTEFSGYGNVRHPYALRQFPQKNVMLGVMEGSGTDPFLLHENALTVHGLLSGPEKEIQTYIEAVFL